MQDINRKCLHVLSQVVNIGSQCEGGFQLSVCRLSRLIHTSLASLKRRSHEQSPAKAACLCRNKGSIITDCLWQFTVTRPLKHHNLVKLVYGHSSMQAEGEEEGGKKWYYHTSCSNTEMQMRHAGPWIASVVNIKGILCNERHNADQHLWRQGGFIDNYCNCDCSCRLKTTAMAEQDLLTCWNKLLMTMKQKYLLAGPRSQPKPLKSLHLRCQCNKRPYISDCSLIRIGCASLIKSVWMA